jgi:hypothetical protein
MKRVLAVSLLMLAGATSVTWTTCFAWAAETETFNYTCKNGNFTVTAPLDNAGRWSKTEPVILQIAGEPPQTLTADPDAPEANSYRNKDYEFYSLKTFTTLTHKSHGVTVRFYNGCRVADAG